MLHVTFLPSGRKIIAKQGEFLNEAAQRFNIDLGGFCNGKGTCKKCAVSIIDNTANMADVLACKYKVTKDILVYEKGSTRLLDEKFTELPDVLTDGEKGYGIGVDIGTTSLVCSLVDLSNGKVLKSKSSLNCQVLYGADTISRIEYVCQGKENLNRLSKLIRDEINRLSYELTENQYSITKYCICGNTAMMHLFLSIMPEKLGVYPFESSYEGLVEGKGKDFNLSYDNATVYIMPIIKSHVGSDMSSGMGHINFERNKKYLYVDIGTNGEIALIRDDKIVVASTAMGPALEGSGIECGVRAIPGAIDTVYVENGELKYTTLNNRDPIGLCGSGLVTLIDSLLKIKEIDASGKMQNDKKIYISKEYNIYVTQEDIRKVQLVKSALYSGMETFVKHFGLSFESIDTLFIAGTFGKYIDIGSAINIGLLPRVKKIEVLGNAALIGCIEYMVSKRRRTLIDERRDKTKHISLSENKLFMDLYVKNMHFF